MNAADKLSQILGVSRAGRKNRDSRTCARPMSIGTVCCDGSRVRKELVGHLVFLMGWFGTLLNVASTSLGWRGLSSNEAPRCPQELLPTACRSPPTADVIHWLRRVSEMVRARRRQ